MAFPTTLKLFQVLVDGKTTHGLAKSIKLPDPKRKFEDYRPGGFDSPVSIDVGGEALKAETVFAGLHLDSISAFGLAVHNGSLVHYMGAYENQETGLTDSVEVVMRGRHNFDYPDGKTGEIGETKMSTVISYYKLVQNGKTRCEIDITKAIFMVDGNDRLKEARAAAGLI